MSQDSQRFAIDERRWRDLVVPSVLAGDLVLPRYDDHAPMDALELVLDSELPTGVLNTPTTWALQLVDDDGRERTGMTVHVVPVGSPLPSIATCGTGRVEWDDVLTGIDQLEQLDALPDAERRGRAAKLLREQIDTIIAMANSLLAAVDRQRHAALLGEVVLRQLPEGLSDAQLERFTLAFEHTSIEPLVKECVAAIGTGSDAAAGS